MLLWITALWLDDISLLTNQSALFQHSYSKIYLWHQLPVSKQPNNSMLKIIKPFLRPGYFQLKLKDYMLETYMVLVGVSVHKHWWGHYLKVTRFEVRIKDISFSILGWPSNKLFHHTNRSGDVWEVKLPRTVSNLDQNYKTNFGHEMILHNT